MTDLISRQEALKAFDCSIGGVPVESVRYVFEYSDRMMSRINALPSAEQQWIPCSERLPEDDRSKVITLANGNAEVGYYSNGDWWCVGDKFTLENLTVIAWMPLPEPYKGDEE